MGLDAVARRRSGPPRSPGPRRPARLDELVAEGLDLIDRHLEQLGQQRRPAPARRRRRERPRWPGPRVRAPSSPLVLVESAVAHRHRRRSSGHPDHVELAEGPTLVERDPALLAQFEEGEEAHDDLDAGLQVAGELSEGDVPDPVQADDELGSRRRPPSPCPRSRGRGRRWAPGARPWPAGRRRPPGSGSRLPAGRGPGRPGPRSRPAVRGTARAARSMRTAKPSAAAA